MKNSKYCFYMMVSLLFMSSLSMQIQAQPKAESSKNFRLTLQHQKLSSDTTFEFDLYIVNNDPETPFELALVQGGIFINPEVYNGGHIKAKVVEGSSELADVQKPLSVVFAQEANIIKLPSRILRPVAKDAPAGIRGTLIPSKGDGLRICTIRLTNSVPFAKTPVQLRFNFEKFPYSTAVSHYVKGINTLLVSGPENCIIKP